jgi:hypothetical protein
MKLCINGINGENGGENNQLVNNEESSVSWRNESGENNGMKSYQA